MSDRELLQAAIEVLRSHAVVNKFTETVWLAVDRKAWDKFMGADEEQTDD